MRRAGEGRASICFRFPRPRALVLALACGMALTFVVPAQAQTPITLVTNTAEPQDDALSGGGIFAQKFRTGSNPDGDGFILTRIGRLGEVGNRDVRNYTGRDVELHSDNGGIPGTVITALLNPDNWNTGDGVTNHFTAPPGIKLEEDTYYWVVSQFQQPMFLRGTQSIEETGEPGWRIDNYWYIYDSFYCFCWVIDALDIPVALMIEIEGYPINAGASVSTSSLTIAEGGNDTYTVKLNSQPASDVTVTIVDPTDNTEVTADPASLTFTSANWGTAQTVTVTSSTDSDIADDTATVTHTVSSSDTDYNGAAVSDVSVTVSDTGQPGVTLSTYHLFVDEGGSASLTVKLNTEPSAETVIRFDLGYSDKSSNSPDGAFFHTSESARFSTVNWNVAQTITMTPREDDDITDTTYTVLVEVQDNANDSDYEGLVLPDLTVTVVDNDVLPGLFIEDSSATEGSAITFTVTLSDVQTAAVTFEYETSIEEDDTATLDTTARGGADFTATASTELTIAAGARTLTLTVPTTGDSEDEEDETFSVVLSDPTNAILQRGTAKGTIVSDDPVIAEIENMEITSSPGVSGYYSAGDIVTVQVEFDAPVTITGTPTIALTIGSTARNASYSAIDGTGKLVTFSYTVTAADFDGDGIAIAAGSIALNGGTISAMAAGASTDLSYQGLPDDIVHLVGKGPEIVAVTITSTPQSKRNQSPTIKRYGLGEIIAFDVTFDTAVVVDSSGGNPRMQMQFAAASVPHEPFLDYAGGSGTETLTFEYVVEAGAKDGNGLLLLSDSVDLNGSTIQDPTGADAELGFTRFHGNFALHPVRGDVLPPGQPEISGIALVGNVLTAAKGSIVDTEGTTKADNGDSGYAYTYQWVRVDSGTRTDISGATSSTYTLAAADAGTQVKVKVSFLDDVDAPETRTSAAYPPDGTVAEAGNTPASGAPAITGAAQVGKTLTAGLGTIADDEDLPTTFPDDYTFQWVRVDADGMSNETDIGTDSGTYTVVAADVGKKIFVEVSFTDGGGTLEEPDPSAAYPSNAPVVAAAGACPPDNDWCTTLTVGFGQQGPYKFYGYSTDLPTDGALADTTIDDGDGTTWTVWQMRIQDGPVDNDIMQIKLDAFLPRGSVFDLGGTTFTVEAGNELSITGQYELDLPAGFAWVHGQDVTVSVKLPESSPATGAPEISGTPQVGETLTADTTGIVDTDGLTSVSYAFQWIRVDANGTSNPVDVGTDDEDYTLVAADEGKRIKVKVTFTDDAGNDEELTSDAYLTSSDHAYPDHGMQPAQSACPADNDWCATMTVGYHVQSGTHYGFSASPSHGALDDTSFEHDGSPFTVEAVGIRQPVGSSNYHVRLDLDAFVPRGSVFELNGFEFTASSAAEQSTTGHYQWNIPSGFRIAEGVDFRVSLKLAEAGNTLATGAPSVMGMAHVGKVLTAGLGTIADADGLPGTFPDDYTFQWVRVNADGVSNPVNVGTDDEYTLVAKDVGKKIFVEVSFTDDRLFSEGPLASAAYPSDSTVAATAGCAPDEIWCATLTVKALSGNHFGCANAQSGKACSNSSTLTEDEFTHASTDYAVTSAQVRSNGQLRLGVNPDLVTGSESLVLHVGSQTFAFQAADTEGANYRHWNNSGLSWSAGEAVVLKLTVAVAAEVILPAPRLPSVDDPNAIWMATLTVANLGSNQYGYDGSQGGGLTDTAFTYLGDDTPLSEGLGYQTVGTLYTIDELFYDTGTGQLLLSLDGAFVGGNAANIFVDVGGERRSFSDAVYTSGPHTYTFSIPNPTWSAGEEVTVKIVVLAEANGPQSLTPTIAESGDRFDVTLTWAAPTGGGAVTGYRVENQPDPALQWRTLASQSGTTYADSGLARGTVRYYRVAALRSGGAASYSEVVRVQAPSETQEVPEKVNHVEVEPAAGSNTALEVAWSRPRTEDSRAPATGYRVQYVQHDGAVPVQRDGEDWAMVTFPRWMERLPWRTWSGVVEAIEFEESTQRSPHLKTVVTGLAPGTNYRVRVSGCTEAGCGEWSYPRRWTTSGAASERDRGGAPDGDAGGLPGQP